MKKKSKKLTYDDYIYYSFSATLVVGLIIVIMYKNYLYRYIDIPVCIFYSNLEIYCPACGMTRAIIALINGNIIKAIIYNPAIIYIIICVTLYLIVGTMCKLLKKDFIIKYKSYYVYIGLAILIMNCVVRNIMLLIYRIEI